MTAHNFYFVHLFIHHITGLIFFLCKLSASVRKYCWNKNIQKQHSIRWISKPRCFGKPGKRKIWSSARSLQNLAWNATKTLKFCWKRGRNKAKKNSFVFCAPGKEKKSHPGSHKKYVGKTDSMLDYFRIMAFEPLRNLAMLFKLLKFPRVSFYFTIYISKMI